MLDFKLDSDFCLAEVQADAPSFKPFKLDYNEDFYRYENALAELPFWLNFMKIEEGYYLSGMLNYPADGNSTLRKFMVNGILKNR